MGKAVKTYVFTADEIRGLIDREAPERLGMSGSKFIEAYFNDSLPDSPAALADCGKTLGRDHGP